MSITATPPAPSTGSVDEPLPGNDGSPSKFEPLVAFEQTITLPPAVTMEQAARTLLSDDAIPRVLATSPLFGHDFLTVPSAEPQVSRFTFTEKVPIGPFGLTKTVYISASQRRISKTAVLYESFADNGWLGTVHVRKQRSCHPATKNGASDRVVVSEIIQIICPRLLVRLVRREAATAGAACMAKYEKLV